MSSLGFSSRDLEIEGWLDNVTHKTFHLLCNFLQPDTALTLKTTAESILNLLPEEDSYSTDVSSFGNTCIDLAEQIPYHHPSQLKLADLLEYLASSMKFSQICESKEMNTRQHFRYQHLGESLRDQFYEPSPERPGHYVNFHAFAANLDERRIFRTDPTWAIWAQREAHEEKRLEEPGLIRDEYMMAAAQWILWYGQTFFKQVLFSREVSLDTLRSWSPGPLYDGTRFLSLHRWHFWRDGFNAVASGEKEDEKGFGQECKVVAAKAAAMMDSLEKNMTF